MSATTGNARAELQRQAGGKRHDVARFDRAVLREPTGEGGSGDRRDPIPHAAVPDSAPERRDNAGDLRAENHRVVDGVRIHPLALLDVAPVAPGVGDSDLYGTRNRIRFRHLDEVQILEPARLLHDDRPHGCASE